MPRTQLRTHGEDAGRLVYISTRWQVIRHDKHDLHAWRVPGFGWGIRIGRLGLVRLP